MLIAEDLLLLLTDDATGKTVVDTTRLDLALAGGVLLELALLGRIDVTGPGGDVKPGRILVRDASPTDDRVLDEALRRIVAKNPRKPEAVVPSLTKGLRGALFDRLAERGIVRADRGTVLGIFPTRSWPAVDSGHEAEVRFGLRDVLVVGRTPTEREAALVSLLHAVDQVPKVVGTTEVPKRELKRRAGEVAAGEFAGAAVKKAVEAVQSAAMAAVMVGGVVAASGS